MLAHITVGTRDVCATKAAPFFHTRGAVRDVGTSPCGRVAFTVGEDQRIISYLIKTDLHFNEFSNSNGLGDDMQTVSQVQTGVELTRIAVHDSFVLVGGSSKLLQVFYDPRTGKLDDSSPPVNFSAYSAKGTCFALNLRPVVDSSSNSSSALTKKKYDLAIAAFSADIIVVSIELKKEIYCVHQTAERSNISALRWSPDGEFFCSGNWNGDVVLTKLELWSEQQQQQQKEKQQPSVTAASAASSPSSSSSSSSSKTFIAAVAGSTNKLLFRESVYRAAVQARRNTHINNDNFSEENEDIVNLMTTSTQLHAAATTHGGVVRHDDNPCSINDLLFINNGSEIILATDRGILILSCATAVAARHHPQQESEKEQVQKQSKISDLFYSASSTSCVGEMNVRCIHDGSTRVISTLPKFPGILVALSSYTFRALNIESGRTLTFAERGGGIDNILNLKKMIFSACVLPSSAAVCITLARGNIKIVDFIDSWNQRRIVMVWRKSRRMKIQLLGELWVVQKLVSLFLA